MAATVVKTMPVQQAPLEKLAAPSKQQRHAAGSPSYLRKLRSDERQAGAAMSQQLSRSGNTEAIHSFISKNAAPKLPLQVSEKSIDFGVIQPGAQIVKSLTICNTSQQTLRFGWKLTPLADLPSVSKLQATSTLIRATASSSPNSLTNYAARLRSRTANKKFVLSNCGSLATAASIWNDSHRISAHIRNAACQRQQQQVRGDGGSCATNAACDQQRQAATRRTTTSGAPAANAPSLSSTARKPTLAEGLKNDLRQEIDVNEMSQPASNKNNTARRNFLNINGNEFFSPPEKLHYLLNTRNSPSIQTLLSRRQLFVSGAKQEQQQQQQPPPPKPRVTSPIANTAVKLPPTSARNSLVPETEEAKNALPTLQNLWVAFANSHPQPHTATANNNTGQPLYPLMDLAALSTAVSSSLTAQTQKQQQLDNVQQQQLEELLGDDRTLSFLTSMQGGGASADGRVLDNDQPKSTKKSSLNINFTNNMLDCIAMRPVWGILQPSESIKVSFCFTSSVECVVQVAAVCVYETLEKFAQRTEYGRQLAAGKLLLTSDNAAMAKDGVVDENDVRPIIANHNSECGGGESDDIAVTTTASTLVDNVVASAVAVGTNQMRTEPSVNGLGSTKEPKNYAVVNLTCVVQKPTFSVDPTTITVHRQPFDVVVERSVEITNGFLGVLPYEVFNASPLPTPHPHLPPMLPGQLYVGSVRGLIEPRGSVTLQLYYLPGRPGVQVLQPWLRMGIADPVCITLTVHAFFPNILFDLPRSLSATTSLRQQLVEQFGSQCVAIVEKSFCDLKETELERLQAVEQYLIKMHADQQARTYTGSTSAAARMEVFAQSQPPASNVFVASQQQQQQQSNKLKSRPLPLHSAPFPDYLLDFGVLVPEEKLIVKRIKIVNPLPAAVHYRRLNGAATETAGAAAINVTIMEETVDSYTRLPPATAHTLEVAFDPSKLAYGPNEKRLVFDVNHGPRFGLIIRARLEHSRLNLSTQKLAFGDVLCGQVKFMTVQLHNPSSVTCQWSIAFSRDDLIKNMKFLPLHLRKEEQRKWQRGRCYDTRPSDGTLQPNERVNIEFAFMPKDMQTYVQRWQLNIEYSPERPEIIARGRGVRPNLEISTPKLDFGVTLPHEEGCVREIVVGNPHKFPIEFFCVQYDEQSRTEDRILSCLEEFQTQRKVLLPPRAPGKELPSELEANYENLQEQLTLPKVEGQQNQAAGGANGASGGGAAGGASGGVSTNASAAGESDASDNITSQHHPVTNAQTAAASSAAPLSVATADATRDSTSSSTVPSGIVAGGFGALRGGHATTLQQQHGGLHGSHAGVGQQQAAHHGHLKSLASIVPRSSSSERAGALDALRNWQELIKERLKQLVHTIASNDQPQQQHQAVSTATPHTTTDVPSVPPTGNSLSPPAGALGLSTEMSATNNNAAAVPPTTLTRMLSSTLESNNNNNTTHTERYMTPLEVVVQNYKRSLATKSQKAAKNASFYAVGIIIDGMAFTGKSLMATNFGKYFNIPVIHVDRLIVDALRRPGASGINQLVYDALTNLPVDEEELYNASLAYNSDGVLLSPSHMTQGANNSPSATTNALPQTAATAGAHGGQNVKQHHHNSTGNVPPGGSFVAQQQQTGGTNTGNSAATGSTTSGAAHHQQTPPAAASAGAGTKPGKGGKAGGAGGKGGAAGAQVGANASTAAGGAGTGADQQQQKPSSLLEIFRSEPFALNVQRSANSITDDNKDNAAHETLVQLRTFALPVELLEAVIKMRLSRPDCKHGFVIEGLDSSFSQSRCQTLAAILGAAGPRKRVYMFSILRRADKVPRLLRRQNERVKQFTEKHNEEEIHYVEQVSELEYERNMTAVQRQAYDAKLLKIKRARELVKREAAAKEKRRIEQQQQEAALVKAQQQALIAAGGGTAAEQEAAAKANAAKAGRGLTSAVPAAAGAKTAPAGAAAGNAARGDAASTVVQPNTASGGGGGGQLDNVGNAAQQHHAASQQQPAIAAGGKQQPPPSQKPRTAAGGPQQPPAANLAGAPVHDNSAGDGTVPPPAASPLDEQESKRLLHDLNKQIPRFTRQSHEYLKSLKSVQKLLDHWDIRQGRFVDVLFQNELRVKALQRSLEEAALMPVSTKKQAHGDGKSVAGGGSAAAGSSTTGPGSGALGGLRTLGVAQPSRMHAGKQSNRSAGGDRGTYENAASVIGGIAGSGVETPTELSLAIQRHAELNEQLRKLIGVRHIIIDREWSLPSDYRLCETEAFVLGNIMPTRQTIEDETVERLNIPRPIVYNVLKKSSLHGELPRPLKEFKFVEEVLAVEPLLPPPLGKAGSPNTWGGGPPPGEAAGEGAANPNNLQAPSSASTRGGSHGGGRGANAPAASPGGSSTKRGDALGATNPATSAASNTSTKDKHKAAVADDDGGSTTSKKSGKKGAGGKAQQSNTDKTTSHQPSATHQSAADGHSNQPTPPSSATPTPLDGHDSSTNLDGSGAERGAVSQEIQELSKQTRKQFIEIDKPRWTVAPRKKLKLKLMFQSEHDAQYSQLITLQVVDFPKCQHSIACQAICSLPKIAVDPHVVFGSDSFVRVGDDEEVQKKWIDSRQTFAFGPVQIAKVTGASNINNTDNNPPTNLAQLPATHRHTMQIQNTSSSTCSIRFGFVSGRRDVFSLLPTGMLTIPPHETQIVELYAHPRAIGFFEDVLLGLIRDNAIPMQYNISCQGAKPELQIVTKQIRFNTIPVRATDTQSLEVKNPSMLPVKYNIAGLEALGQDFAVPVRTGIVPPRSNASIKMLFIPPSDRAVSHPKKSIVVEATDVEGQLGTLLNESVQVFAESYDLVVDLSFPKANETGVDFGIVRIGEEMRAQMTLKNKSRYECRFEYVVPDPKYRKFFFVIPHEGVLQPGDKPVVVTLGVRAVEPLCLVDEAAIKVKLCDPNLSSLSMANGSHNTNGREMASIPVKVTLKTGWAQCRIVPRDVYFTTCYPSTLQTQTILIENTGGFEFKYALRKLELGSTATGGDSTIADQQAAAAAAARLTAGGGDPSARTQQQKRTKSSANVLMPHFPSTKGGTKAATIPEGDETKAGGSSSNGLENSASTETLTSAAVEPFHQQTLLKPNSTMPTRLSTKISAAPSMFATSIAGGGGGGGPTNMSTVTKAEKRGDKNNDANATGGKLQSGMFSFSPLFGTVQAGQTATITVEFYSEIEGVFNDYFALDITDRNPAVKADEFRIGVHGEVSVATIAMDNYEQLFDEHLIILQAPQTPRAHELMRRKLRKTNIYVRERNKFYYRHTQVGTRQTARFKIFNPSSMPCDVSVQIVGPKTITPGPGARQQLQQQQQQQVGAAAALQTGGISSQDGAAALIPPITVATPTLTAPPTPAPPAPTLTKQQQKAAAAAAAAAEQLQQQQQNGFHGTTLVPIVQDDFIIETPQLTIQPHSFEYLQLSFAPKAVHAYNAVVDIGIDNHALILLLNGGVAPVPAGPTGTMLGGGLGTTNKQPPNAANPAALAVPPRTTAIRFEVHGDGTLPHITVPLPKQRDSNGRALLSFGKQYVGGLQTLPLRLVNDSLLKCTVVVHALAYGDIFRIRAVGACKRDTSFHHIVDDVNDPVDAEDYSMASGDNDDASLRCKRRSTLNVILPRDHVELAPQEELSLEVDFIPNAAGIYDDVIYVEVDGNPFSNIGLIASGEAYGDTVIVENSHVPPKLTLP